MGTTLSGYGSISDSTRVSGESGASPEPDDAGRASAMPALHPIHPIDRHLYRRVYRAGTDSRPSRHAQEPSARRIGVDQATRSHFDDAYYSKTLHCGIVRLKEDWLDMDCVARKCQIDCERSRIGQGEIQDTPASGANR